MTPTLGSTAFVVGSYSEPYGPFRAVGEGLTLIGLEDDGRLTALDCLALPNPSYVRPIGGNRVAVTLETDDERAGIALVAVEKGRLRLAQRIDAPGRIPCHLDMHPAGQWLAGACYGSGEVFAVPIGKDGWLASERMVMSRHRGASIHPVRQTSPHPHATRFSPDGRWVVAPDLGTDKVTSYRFDPAMGPDFSSTRAWTAQPGSGPRLASFSPDGRYLVLVEEIASAVTSLRWEDGELRDGCRLSSLIKPLKGENTASGLRWHPSGRAIAVSNRGADSVSLFYFDSDGGSLAPWREFSCGGSKPRDLTFSRCGRWLITSAQNSDLLAVFFIDIEAGEVRDTGERLAVRSPSCVRALLDKDGAL